jgi:hypothetical protein
MIKRRRIGQVELHGARRLPYIERLETSRKTKDVFWVFAGFQAFLCRRTTRAPIARAMQLPAPFIREPAEHYFARSERAELMTAHWLAEFRRSPRPGIGDD